MPIEQSVPEAVDSLDLLPMITDSTLRRAKFREVVGFEFWLACRERYKCSHVLKWSRAELKRRHRGTEE